MAKCTFQYPIFFRNSFKAILAMIMLISLNSAVQAQQQEMMVRISEIEIHPKYPDEYKSILKYEAEASVRLEPGVIAIFPMFQKDGPAQVNMRDIANLMWENLQDDIIVVYREKTKRLNRQRPKRITVIRNEIINNIIGQWGNKPGKPQELVFNIVDATDDAQTRMDKVLQFIKVTNKWMKRIGTELGFGLSLTTYVARHSFSTMLLKSGASVEFISENLGHSDIKTTQFYPGGFDLDAKKEMMKTLVDFG